jgi:hypothetical protein
MRHADLESKSVVKRHGDFHMDAEGYIYWKDRHVEHFNKPEQLNEDWVAHATPIITHLLSLGVTVSCSTFVWHREWFEGLKPDNVYLPLLRLLPDFYQHGFTAEDARSAEASHCPVYPIVEPDGSAMIVKGRALRFKKGEGISPSTIEKDELEGWYHPMAKANYHIPRMGQAYHNGIIYASSAQLVAWLDRYVGPENVAEIVNAL